LSEYYIGLLSGTSVDGIDAAIIDFSNNQIKVKYTHQQDFSKHLKQGLQNLIKSQTITLEQYSDLDSLLAFEFSQAVDCLINKSNLKRSDIIAIGSHGQTIYHQPDGNHPNTIQIGSPHKIASMSGINVVSNFRHLDMAFSGQGAPLAPIIHQKLFEPQDQNIAVINLGGIANVSFIGKNYNQIIGFDIGPANCLLDEWINIHKQKAYDEDGSWARQGQLNETLLEQMLNDNYFKKLAPKSTGREYFNHKWYDNFKDQFRLTSATDIQTTLSHLVAVSIELAITNKSIDKIILMGGGAKNGFIIELIEKYSGIPVQISNEYGYDSDWVEAILFGYLAYKRVNCHKLNLTSFTGSTRPLLIGDIVTVV